MSLRRVGRVRAQQLAKEAGGVWVVGALAFMVIALVFFTVRAARWPVVVVCVWGGGRHALQVRTVYHRWRKATSDLVVEEHVV